MTNAAEMQIVVELKDKASASLKNVNRSFSSTAAGITKGVAKMAAGFALLMGAAAIGGTILALKKSISVFQEFEYAVASAASVTGAVGEAFEATKKNIEEVSKELGRTTVFSASEAANAFYDLASAGYDVANMAKSDLQPILDVAAGTQSDLTKTTEVLTSTLGQFGLGIESIGRVADVFARSIGTSKAELIKLQFSLKQAGPIANSLGMEIEEVVAILGNLYNAGFAGEQAGTALRGAFARLLNPTKAVEDAMFRLGLTMEDVNPETKDFADILDTLSDAGMDTADAFVIFGQEVAPAITALVENTDGIRELEESLYDAGGAAETMALQNLDTLKGSSLMLKSALEGLQITIGEKLEPHFRSLTDKITDMIPAVTTFAMGIMDLAGDIWRDLEPALKKLWDKFKDIYPTIKTVGSELINRLKPAFDDLKSAFDSIIKIGSNLISGFSKNETAMGSLTAVINIAIDTFNWFAKAISTVLGFLAEHPRVAAVVVGAILLMVAPILKIIAIMVILATAWDQNWFGIKDTTLKVVDIIVDYLKWSFQHIENFWSKHGDTIMAVVNYMWTGIKTTIDIVLSTISLIVNVFLDILEGDWSGAWERIKEYTSETFTKLASLFESWKSNILPIFTGVWDSFKEKVAGWAEDTWSKIKTWVSDVIQKFVDFKDSVIATIKGWYDTIIGFFDFSDVQVKWPTIPDPFAGVDWCGSIPSWVKNALGICGGTTPSAPGYEKYNVYQEPDLPPYERAAPHSKYSKHDKSHSEYDVWTQHNKSGHEKWQRVHMADGGPVDKDLDARLHEGEYVVPKAGTLVMGGSPQKDGHVQMTYNIGTVNGVDGLEKLLEKHDRELYRRLVSLV